jgi:hypothetical protein
VLPFWDFHADKENHLNSLRLVNKMKNRYFLQKHIELPSEGLPISEITSKQNWKGCFGVQSFISHRFLSHLVNKFDLFQLLKLVTCRADRCCLERIFGILFSLESKFRTSSLLGNIHHYQNFDYNYEQYKEDLFIKKKIPHAIIKVWTGR